MSLCEYCSVGAYDKNCTCTMYNDICPLMRRCSDRRIWLPLKSMDKCTRKIQQTQREEDVELKDGEYKVAYIRGNKLYVDIDGNLFRIANPFDYEPQKVKLKKVDNEMVIVTDEIKETKEDKDTVDKKKKK